MSTIERLSIQGIRSFGPNVEDVQSITFSSPVTLILGENGCGKTTIIECLKYALTGESPPGSDRGRSFVHDPKLFSLTGTLGQIKLQVRNIRGQRISVCRSMKIFSRRGKYSFETLDSTINYMDASGQGNSTVDSISKRCIDVDAAMCQFMGVSKAIINNVLLCHQEDSSWPLDEAKKLKEKFDAIFGITEFNKAIEKIVKIRKEEMDNLKVKEGNLRLLAYLKQEMEDKSINLRKAEEKCEALRAECNDCENEMKPIEARLEEIRNIEFEVGKYQAQKVELETKRINCQEQISSLNKKIRKPFEGNLDDLDREIRLFAEHMTEKKIKYSNLEKKVNALKSEEKELQKKFANLDKKRVVLIQNRHKEQECISKRAEKLKLLCVELNIKLAEDPEYASDIVPLIVEEIENVLTNKQCEIAEMISKFDNEDHQHQTKIDALRVDLTKVDERMVALQKQKAANEKDYQTTVKEIDEIEKSAQRIAVLTENIELMVKRIEETKANFNQENIRKDIADAKARVVQLQKQFRETDERLTKLNSISKLLAEITLKTQELEKKEQDVRRVKNKHGDNLKRLFSNTVDSNYRRALQGRCESLRNKIKELHTKANELRLKEQSCEIKRKNLKGLLLQLEKELEQCEEKIYEKCHSTPYEDALAKCYATVTKYQLDHGLLLSAESMYKRYIEKINDDPCCPLCHRGMSNNEAMDITTELTDEIQQLPENIKNAEKLLKAEQKKYEGLLEIKQVIETVSRLKAEIPEKKKELKNLEEELAQYVAEHESLQILLAEPTLDLDIANSMMGDMSLLDESIKDALRLKQDIATLKHKLPEDHVADVSIDDLQMTKSAVSEELDNERKNVEDKQHVLEKYTDALNKLQERKNSCQVERIRLQEGIQSISQLKERQVELKKSIESSNIEIQELRIKIPTLKQKLDASISEKNRQKESSRKKVAEMQTKLDLYKNTDHDIQRLNNEVLEYQALNLEDEISRLKDCMKDCKFEIDEKTHEISVATESLEAIKMECLNQETLERDLKDNRELKILQKKNCDLDEKSDKLLKQIGELDFGKVSKEKNMLIQKRDQATVRKGEVLGQVGEIQSQIKKLKSEINEPKLKDSLHNYRRAYYEVEVSRQLIKDLAEYRIGLEWSLMKFHAEKMEKINRLIREYWRLIYRGNDIDYIQIQTEEGNTEAAMERRRNYNYRVIQSKNNSEIEMRGRCSAGQRVLASLIIRMALAETFSSNCGVLALDEPTTNLDRMNILSLCKALNRIVDDRRMQSNFMLIIITHDEEFISTLGKINSYHRVFRNEQCKSVIRKVKVA